MWGYNYTDELCHYGVKGMKWGVRRKRSRTQRDARKLSDTAVKYYDAVNKRNALFDTGGAYDNDSIYEGQRSAQKLVDKLQRKYKTVSVIPEFEENGYVVKNVNVLIEKVDRLGRTKSVVKSSTPVETYNKWRDEADPKSIEARNKIHDKYSKKRAAAKTEDERVLLELDMLDELDEL